MGRWPARLLLLLALTLALLAAEASCGGVTMKTEDETAAVDNQTRTMCNPLNLGYRFRLEAPSRREAADPTMVVFERTYFLFASKSG